ncbi:MAG TPA: hypothetical protein PKK00_10765 [Bacteroidales bacterium]|nr:hypothetical protein [Bacteroidales bacterium]HPS17855.1 hypothetical protein [Bacteroidales bacterium]
MKKIILASIVIAFSFNLNAQEIKVKEEKEKIAEGTNPVLTVMIYEADESMVEKSWKELMKDYNAKVSNKSEIFADNASITDMSQNTVDVYAYTKKEDDGIKLIVAFDLGGAFVSSSTHSSAYNVAEKIVKKFAVDVSKKAIQKKVDAALAKQKDLEDELASLKKKNEKLHGDIEDYKKKITEAESDISDNEKAQVEKTKEIEDQTKAVKEVQEKLDDVK